MSARTPVDQEIIEPGKALQASPVRPLPAWVTPTRRNIHLNTIGRCRREMAMVYRQTRRGELPIDVSTRLIFMLNQVVQALKSEIEVEALVRSYAEAWTGLHITYAGGADDKSP